MSRSWTDFANAQCPLTVGWVAWEDPTLVIRGEAWSFTTTSAWRVRVGPRFIGGCEDPTADEAIASLRGAQLTRVESASSDGADVALVFEDGRRLEVFAANAVEPWVLRLPTPPILIPVPGDPRWFAS